MFSYGINHDNDRAIHYDRRKNFASAFFSGNAENKAYFTHREILKVLANTHDKVYLIVPYNRFHRTIADICRTEIVSCSIDTDFENFQIPDNAFTVFLIQTSPLYLSSVYGNLVSLIQKQIQNNQQNGIRSWVYLDNADMTADNEQVSNQIYEMFLKSETLYCTLTYTAETFRSMKENPVFCNMIYNTAFTVLFPHSEYDMTILEDVYRIDNAQKDFLLHNTKKHGLIALPDSTELIKSVML